MCYANLNVNCECCELALLNEWISTRWIVNSLWTIGQLFFLFSTLHCVNQCKCNILNFLCCVDPAIFQFSIHFPPRREKLFDSLPSSSFCCCFLLSPSFTLQTSTWCVFLFLPLFFLYLPGFVFLWHSKIVWFGALFSPLRHLFTFSHTPPSNNNVFLICISSLLHLSLFFPKHRSPVQIPPLKEPPICRITLITTAGTMFKGK